MPRAMSVYGSMQRRLVAILLASFFGGASHAGHTQDWPTETRREYRKDGTTAKVWTAVRHGSAWLKDGEFRSFHDNGELSESGTYIVVDEESVRHGVWKKYLTNGAIVNATPYQWDRRHGTAITYHFAFGLHEANRKRTLTDFEDGYKNGRFLEYCRDGETVRRTGQYVWNKRAGVWKTLLPWDCNTNDPVEPPKLEDLGNLEPPAADRKDKPAQLSTRTKGKLAEYSQLIEKMEDAQRVAGLLSAFGSFFNLMDGLDLVDLYQYWDGPWDNVREAIIGLPAAHRADLRFFARAEALEQLSSRPDYLFWRKIADELRSPIGDSER